MVSEKKIFSCVSHYKPMADNDRMACTVDRIYKEDHYILLYIYTQNIKVLGLVVLEKKIFLCFSNCKSMGAICCHGNQSSDPNSAKT